MLSLLQTSCACSLGFFIAKVLERDDCIYFIFAQLPVSYSFVQCSRHSTPSVIDLGRVTSNLLVTKSCPLMLLFTLDLLASVNTVDYSLLLNTLSMTSLSSFSPPLLLWLLLQFPLLCPTATFWTSVWSSLCSPGLTLGPLLSLHTLIHF